MKGKTIYVLIILLILFSIFLISCSNEKAIETVSPAPSEKLEIVFDEPLPPPDIPDPNSLEKENSEGPPAPSVPVSDMN